AGDAGDRQVPRLAHRHPHGARSVDPVDIVSLTRSLVDIDSTTGREGECGRWLADYLRSRDWSVDEQRVDDTRCNVIATIAENRRGDNNVAQGFPPPLAG